MAIPVEMPKMSDTMEEGVLVEWLAEEGSEVSAGDVIAQVETDKATMDLEVYDDGVLLKKVVQAGDAVPIGGLIAVLGDEGEDVSEILSQYEGQSEIAPEPVEKGNGRDEDRRKERAGDAATESEAAPEEEPGPSGDGARREGVPRAAGSAPAPRGGDGRIKSSPLARRMAGDHGIELHRIEGSGPEGRIIKRDVEAVIEAGVRPAEAPEVQPFGDALEEGFETEAISQMRKTISRRLAQSKFASPHFYLTVDVDMAQAVASRGRINDLANATQDGVKISYNDLITKACAMALRRHPQVNASYLEQEGEIRRYNHVHVAVAVAIDEGLLTPVIRHADRKGLARIAVETQDLAKRARERKLQPNDWEGSTFTTSNLGMYGIEEFTAIINPPNSCILAIGAIRDVPVVENDAIVAGKRMKMTLSCDHRLVDGATGAAFLSTVQSYLEEPLAMLL